MEEILRSAQDDKKVARDDTKGAGLSRTWRIVIWSVLGLAVLFFALLAILGRVAPQLVDPLLYNSEELQLLNSLL